MRNATLIELFEASVRKYPNNVLLWEKQGSAYQGMTYAQTREAVYTFAAGLISLGVEKGDRVALIAEGRNDWVISELGILYAGAIQRPTLRQTAGRKRPQLPPDPRRLPHGNRLRDAGAQDSPDPANDLRALSVSSSLTRRTPSPEARYTPVICMRVAENFFITS